MEGKKIIIFDLDGVLWQLDFKEFGRMMAKDLRIEENLQEEFASKIKTTIATLLKKNTIKITERVIMEIITENIPDLAKYKVDASMIYNCFTNPKYEYCKNNPNALEVVKTLYERGYLLLVKTNWFANVQIENLKRYGYAPYFKEVVGMMDDYMKPNPLSVAKLLGGEDPSNFIIIGDTPKKEMKLANDLGMESIWLNEGNEPKPEDETLWATYEVQDIKEILNILK
jgi:FMN phosphatase YigB (HAD superfamily)